MDYRLQKTNLKRTRIAVGGETSLNIFMKLNDQNIVEQCYQYPHAKYVCADVKRFYLNMPMECSKYVCMPIKLIPQSFIEECDLQHKNKDGLVYIKLEKACMD